MHVKAGKQSIIEKFRTGMTSVLHGDVDPAALGIDALDVVNFHIDDPPEGTTQYVQTKIANTKFRKTALRAVVTVSVPESGSSPKYLAAKRRGGCKRIAAMISDLGKHDAAEDFCIWTYAPLVELKKLIHFIDVAEEYADHEHEGNSCEVLRQVRDTFLKGGNERYRDAAVRKVVETILVDLSHADDVDPSFADKTLDRLMDVGLDPAVM